MNRRDMLKSGLAVLSAVGIDGEIATVSAKNPQMFVIRVRGVLPSEAARRLRDQWKLITRGTSMEKIPAIVLEEGASIEVIDKVD